MGSALRDSETGKLIWGLSDPRWYLKAWTQRDGLRALRMTDDELEGRTGRVRPDGLLRFPSWAPWLAGFEPYTGLVREIEKAVVDPAAILEFDYDWRLPVAHNARLLADAAARHLETWRGRPAQLTARRQHPDGRPAQLVLVAHSMGGLLAQGLTTIPGATDEIRTTITMGTPFYGAVKSAVILNSGRGGPIPLPRRQLRSLAATLPGVHDLLPTYRCVHTDAEPVRLAPGDVEAIGGDRELATRSADFQVRVNRAALVGHHSLVGVRQKTVQGMRVRDGVVHPVYRSYTHGAGDALVTKDFQGDGTVYWESAALIEGFHEVVQQHGTLPASPEAASLVRELLLAPGGRPRPLLGAAEIGMEPPDLVAPDQEFAFPVSDIGVTCAVFELTGDRPRRPLDVLAPRWEDGEPRVRLTLARPGMYRITLNAGGLSPVSQLLMAAE